MIIAGMNPSAQQAFLKLTNQFEGHVGWMYLDVIGLVTTGCGNLIDPISLAMKARWLRDDGSPALPSDVVVAWTIVKKRRDLAQYGARIFKPLTKVHLDESGIMDLTLQRLAGNEIILRHEFPAYDSWPVDAIVALNSMSWARGPNKWHNAFPRFSRAMDKMDFEAAAEECRMGGPGLDKRNALNKLLLVNAAQVVAKALPYSELLTEV